MKEHLTKARSKASEIYSKRDEYKAQAAPHAEKLSAFFNKHIEKALMTGIVISEIWQGESLDNIEHASNVSAAVDYDNYTKG